jgi:hypothetical protein
MKCLAKAIQALQYSSDPQEAFAQWNEIRKAKLLEAREKLQLPFEQLADVDADFGFLANNHGYPDQPLIDQAEELEQLMTVFSELIVLLREYENG